MISKPFYGPYFTTICYHLCLNFVKFDFLPRLSFEVKETEDKQEMIKGVVAVDTCKRC